jgi:hypothetical protein
MRYLPPLRLCALATLLIVKAGQAQQIDPTRLNEGIIRPSSPTLADQQNMTALGLEDQNTFAPASPGDDDLGQQLILKETPKERWLRAQADFFGFWTDNAANASEGEEEDYFWGGRVSLGAQPRITNLLYADADVTQNVYRYDEYDGLDFESLEASVGLLYVIPKLMNSIVFVQGHFNRITNDDFSNDLVNSWSIRAGIQKTFLFDRRNSLHVNLMGDWDIDTDFDQLFRHEYIGDLGYRFKIMRDLVFGVSYRFTYFDYQDVDRSDVLNLVGASLTWSPWKWMDVYASGNWSINDSDADVFDYETANVGGGVGVRVRF